MKNLLIIIILILCFGIYSDQVTIYNDNFSLVRTSLEMKLQKGLQSYFMDDIPTSIEPSSVIINPQKGEIEIFSQNYEYDLAGTNQILYKYIGKEIEVITKTDQVFRGKLQFNDNLTIGLIDADTKRMNLISLSEIRNISLTRLPENFFLKPTLHWQLNADKTATYEVDFSYLCHNMLWEVTYNCVWNEQSEQLTLNSWVTITNETGKGFKDVKLKLIAGDVNKISQQKIRGGRSNELMFKVDAMSARSPEFEEKAFHDFHMYTLSENVSINNNQTKQLRLFPTEEVKAKSHYQYTTYTQKIISQIKFMNSQKDGLGIPLPKGEVKIYQLDTKDDQLEFIGEDRIDHTAEDEEVTLKTGSAFDLVAKTMVMNTRKISSKVNEKDMKVILKNRSKQTKEITILHNLNNNWNISRENVSYEKKSAYQIEFIKNLKPGEEFELIWTERIEY